MKFFPTLAAVAAVAAFLWAVWTWLQAMRRPAQQPSLGDKANKNDYWIILGMVLAAAITVYAIGVMGANRNGISGTVLEKLEQVYSRADAHHYLDVAWQGYVNEGESRLYIVFFPLFPLLVKLVSFLTGGHLFLAAILVNIGCLYGACLAIYRLCLLDHSRTSALRAVRLLLLFPASFFYFVPYTESVFLLCASLSLYCSRRRKWALAGLFAMLCALSRLPGALCAVPLVIEAFHAAREEGQQWLKPFLRKAAWVGLPVLGIAVYLGINYVVTGDPLRFLFYQKDHWNQGFRLFPQAVSNIVTYMIGNTSQSQSLLWSGQFVAIALFLWLIIGSAQKLRTAQSGYVVAMFFMVTSANWLLSAPRYLMVVFPVYFYLADLLKKPWADMLWTVVSAGCFLLYTYHFAIGYSIY